MRRLSAVSINIEHLNMYLDIFFFIFLQRPPNMTVTNEHIFKSAFNPAFPRQISKYYNHYEIGEFPPRLCLLNAIGQKNFITFESKMSLQFL